MNPLQLNAFTPSALAAHRGVAAPVPSPSQPVSPLETFTPTTARPAAEISLVANETPVVSKAEDTASPPAPPSGFQALNLDGLTLAGPPGATGSNPTTLTMFDEPPSPPEPAPEWVEKTNHKGQSYKERPLASLDGGPAWREIVFPGGKPFRQRQLAAVEGGPAWKEIQFPDSQSPGYKQRSVPAEDGGPAWEETLSANGNLRKTRTVPSQDGGPDWRESVSNGETQRQRNLPSQDDKPDWSEVVTTDKHTKSRRFEADGITWKETITGDKGKRTSQDGMPGLRVGAQKLGTTSLQTTGPEGPLEIQVHGTITPEQLENLKGAIQAMPPAARLLARDITVLESLGADLGGQGEVSGDGPGGLAGSGLMGVKASQLDKPFNARRVVFHETGHLLDKARGVLSDGPPWGDGSSVSAYGKTTPGEDFAEVHRVVLADFARYQAMSPADWARESECAKKLQIAGLYGVSVPTADEIKIAETAETLRQRSLNQLADSATSGREAGPVITALDGGAPWVEKVSLEGKTFRQRSQPAEDGAGDWLEIQFPDTTYKKRTLATDDGPQWTEFQFPDSKPYRQRMMPSGDGGPDWKEVQFTGSKPYKSRTVSASDGGPDWKESLTEGSAATRSRRVQQHGLAYEEKWQGDKWSRHPVGDVGTLNAAARVQGTSSFTVAGPEGPLEVQVHGGATAAELQTLKTALLNLPPAARALTTNISLAQDLGQFRNASQETPTQIPALHDGSALVLQRAGLKDHPTALRNLAHGVGLGSDRQKKISQELLWKNAQPGFTSIHNRVLRDFQRFSALTEEEWAARPDAAKERAIVALYQPPGVSG